MSYLLILRFYFISSALCAGHGEDVVELESDELLVT